MEALLAALVLGFAGSLHCVGMCGPIALALPIHQFRYAHRILALSVYHAGRILTYGALGSVFSFFGAGLLLASYQQVLSVVLGTVLLLAALFSLGIIRKRLSVFKQFPFKKQMAGLLRRRSIPAFFASGVLNGLLPCGLLYVAMAGATLSTSVLNGALFMVAFGLGTFPAMMSISLVTTFSGRVRAGLRMASPLLTLLAGILLILRGMGLGIPLISPKIDNNNKVESCSVPLQTNSHDENTH